MLAIKSTELNTAGSADASACQTRKWQKLQQKICLQWSGKTGNWCRKGTVRKFMTSLCWTIFPISATARTVKNSLPKTAVKMAVNMAVSLACPQLSPALWQVLSQALSQDEEKDASIDSKDATSNLKVATLDEESANLADNGQNSTIRKQRQELHKELQW